LAKEGKVDVNPAVVDKENLQHSISEVGYEVKEMREL